MTIVGIYLAAGQSKRMGCEKLALPLGDRPLGSVAMHTALTFELDRLLVITKPGDALQWVAPLLWEEPWRSKWEPIPCADAWQGQANSLKCGVRAAQARVAAAVLVLLADQPFVTREMIDAILQAHKTQKQGFVAAGFQGIARPPVLFDAAWFPKLLQLSGDQGARRLLQKEPDQGQVLAFDQARSFLDVDTPEDYRNLFQ